MKTLGLVLFAALMAAATPRIAHFPGGEAQITKAGGTQHVIMKDRAGNVTSISDCDADSGSYDQIVALAGSLKSAARRGDRRAMAAMMRYPLRVNTGAGHFSVVEGQAAFLKRYGTILGAGQSRKLQRLEPNEVFCRDGMSMLAGGVMWAQMRRGALRVVAISTAP